MSEALIPPIYGEVLELRRHFRLLYGTQALNYLLATPAPTAAQLTAWLDTPANLDAYQRLLATNAGASAVCASSAIMAAVAASPKALETLRDSGPGSAALVNSKTAIDAVLAAGAAAISSVLSIGAVRTAVFNSDTAFNTLVASDAGKNALNSMASEHLNIATTHVYPPGVNAASRTVLVSQKSGGASYKSHAGASEDTYTCTSATFLDRYVRITGLTHRAGATGSLSYSTIRYVVMQ